MAIEDMPDKTPSSPDILEKPIKLKERKRWVMLERQRLTYYETSTLRGPSKKKIKGAITLDPSTTRVCVAPPMPNEASLGGVGESDLGRPVGVRRGDELGSDGASLKKDSNGDQG